MVQLVHDLRTPLGVAVGYLRLLRDKRLPDESDQQRAVAQAVESLGVMARLCEDASAFAASAGAGSEGTVMIPAGQFIAEVGEHLAAPLSLAPIDDEVFGQVRAKPGVTGRSTALLLSRTGSAGGPDPTTDIIVRMGRGRLSFLRGTPEQHEELVLGKRHAFDPWRAGPGLALPLACFELSLVSGEVWTAAAGVAMMVTLPVEISTT